jgi:intracellular sulfur oxidation DsrE/DsrF family protein
MLRNQRTVWILATLLIALVGWPILASEKSDVREPRENASVEPKSHGKLVVVLTSGLEDLQSVNMAIRHAGMAKNSGYLDDVALLVYGRGVQAFAKEITAKPPQVGKSIQEAKDAGVRILVCAEALKKFNIPHDGLEPGVQEVVPNAIITLSELVSQGYQILKY